MQPHPTAEGDSKDGDPLSLAKPATEYSLCPPPAHWHRLWGRQRPRCHPFKASGAFVLPFVCGLSIPPHPSPIPSPAPQIQGLLPGLKGGPWHLRPDLPPPMRPPYRPGRRGIPSPELCCHHPSICAGRDCQAHDSPLGKGASGASREIHCT